MNLLHDPFLWVSAALFLLVLLVFLNRLLHLYRARVDEQDLLSGILNNLRNGNYAEAVHHCNQTPGPVARLLGTAIANGDRPAEDLAREIDTAAKSEISRLEHRISFIGWTAQVAPLIGLVGAAAAILRFLRAAHESFPLVSSLDVTDGLIPAAANILAGLLVAFFAYSAFRCVVMRADRLIQDMEHAATAIVRYLEAHPVPHEANAR